MDIASIISDLSQADLIRFVPTVIRGIVLRNGIWLSKVQHHLGLEEALAIENDVSSTVVPIVTRRIGDALQLKTNGGFPSYATMSSAELTEPIIALSISWLATEPHHSYLNKLVNLLKNRKTITIASRI